MLKTATRRNYYVECTCNKDASGGYIPQFTTREEAETYAAKHHEDVLRTPRYRVLSIWPYKVLADDESWADAE
jgi:hypothetical protein